MTKNKANLKRLVVGQIYEGSSKPKAMYAPSTQRRVLEFDVEKDFVKWEPVEPIKKYDHSSRSMTVGSFFQWADVLIYTP